MGKRSVKCHAIRKLETLGKRSLSYLRDTFPDESNDSGLGSDAYSSFPESNSSSCVEESDLDSSSESIDSCTSRRPRLPKHKKLINNGTSDPSRSYTLLQIDSSLALSLNNKMHIQHSHSETECNINGSSCHNEPSAKRRKIFVPVADLSDNSSSDLGSRENISDFGRDTLRFTLAPSSGFSPAVGVLTETCGSGNSIAKDSLRNDFDNKDSVNNKDGCEWSTRDSYVIRGTPDHSSKNGDRIAALLSANSNSLVRKRSMKKPSLHVCFPSRSKDGKIELCILIQPEEQHRARYMTEGSRGSIKDEKGTGFPTVKLVGYSQPVVLQIFIGSDQGKVQPHLFYQACKVTGKNCTPCSERVIDGTCVIEITMVPESDMTVSCDCIGILKERNVDVEQRLPYFGLARCKKRSTKCRMVFRVNIPLANGNFETLQVASSQILCTQSPGLPEICKKSLTESSAKGGAELFIIGKNFQKDAKVVFQEFSDVRNNPCYSKDIVWEEMVDPEKEYTHQSHLVCSVPPYRDLELLQPVKVFLSVLSGGKSSEPHTFTYTPPLPVKGQKLDHPPIHQANVSSAALERNHEFHKNGMVSPVIEMANDPGFSPSMIAATSTAKCGMGNLLPSLSADGGCRQHSQLCSSSLSALSIQLVSPSLNSTLSPTATMMGPVVSPLGASDIGNPFESRHAAAVPISSIPNEMMIDNVVDIEGSAHLQAVEKISHSSSSSSLSSSLPSSPTNLNSQLSSEEIISDLPSEDHHDVDLMSGINQLASEIVKAQEDASSHAAQMVSAIVEKSTDLSSLSCVSTEGFNGGNIHMANHIPLADLSVSLVDHHASELTNVHSLSIVASAMPSVNHLSPNCVSVVGSISPLIAKLEPSLPSSADFETPSSLVPFIPVATNMSVNTNFSLDTTRNLFASPGTVVPTASHNLRSGGNGEQLAVADIPRINDSSLDVKPICLISNAHLQVSELLTGKNKSINDTFVATSESLLHETSHLSKCKTDALIYTPSDSSLNKQMVRDVCGESGQMCISESRATSADLKSTVIEGLLFSTDVSVAKNPTSAMSRILPSAIKCEKPEDLNCFQQTMTLALSQLSDADLLSIINPSTFDSV